MSNLGMLHSIAKGLDYLLPSVVFVGGSVTELYATDPAATEVRPTDDVDCVVELVSYSAFGDLEANLRKLKFTNDTEDGIICRWRFMGLKVDIMPQEGAVLGFTNRWYSEGVSHTINHSFEDGTVIRVFKPAYFLASKFVAFVDRGGSDYRTSSDFEDIIYVLDNRENIVEELSKCNAEVLQFLKDECRKLVEHKGLEEAIACALPLNSDKDRNERIQDILRAIVTL